MRRRPPETRRSITHRFEIRAKDDVVVGYVVVGLFEDGTPAEMFLFLARAGETLRGLARCWATCFSICLQYGAPLETLIEKSTYFRFEPSGWTDNPNIRQAHSIADYVCRWMELTFLRQKNGAETQSCGGVKTEMEAPWPTSANAGAARYCPDVLDQCQLPRVGVQEQDREHNR